MYFIGPLTVPGNGSYTLIGNFICFYIDINNFKNYKEKITFSGVVSWGYGCAVVS